MDSDIQLQVVNDNTPQTGTSSGSSSGLASASVPLIQSRHPDLPKIRFLPDGSIGEGSPKAFVLTGRDGNSVSVQQSRNGLSYEIRVRPNQ